MKGLTAFEAIGNLNDSLIMSAVISEDVIPVATSKRPSAFARWMTSGWGAAAICAIVAVSVMGGIIWAGNRPDPTPGVTSPVVSESKPETVTEEEDRSDPPISDVTVRLRQYTWDGWGITSKALDPQAAARLLEKLRALRPTGEYTEALAPGTMAEEYEIDVPGAIERGTYWIEAEGQVYRLSPDLDAIWLVDRHYGSGQKLNADDAFFDIFYDYWQYHPYDSYVVTYEGDEFTVNHVYEATAPIRVELVELQPDFLTDDIVASAEAQHKITLRITAPEQDIQTRIDLQVQYSDDHLLLGSGVDLTLEAGVPQTVTLTYPGCLSWGFEVNIFIENVRIYLHHRPM